MQLSMYLSLSMLLCLNSLKYQRTSSLLVRSLNFRLLSTGKIDSDNLLDSTSNALNLRYGKAVNVTILQFGPLGASVSLNDHSTTGLILQNELGRYRDKRDGDEVKVGEKLIGYVERVREDGKVDISLRPGVTARITEVKEIIMDALLGSPSGTILIGDKSSSEDIASYFHGISKTDFKNAIGALYREKLIVPGKLSTSLATDKVEANNIIQTQKSQSTTASTKTYKRYSKTIFIGNLAPNTEQTDFTNFLQEILGKDMMQVRLALDNETKKSRGFAFVDMDDCVDDLQSLVNKLNKVTYRGRQLRSDIDIKKDSKSS